MITKSKWKKHDKVSTCIESENGIFLETIGHLNLWSDKHVEHMLACVNACRGMDTKELQDKDIVSIVSDQLLKQDEIIQKLIDLVEHYGSCYNHDLNAYQEYRVAKRYMEDKNV